MSTLAKEQSVRNFGRAAAVVSALTCGVVGGVAIHLLFPAWGLTAAVLIGIGSAVSETMMFWRDSPKSMILIFVRGISSQLENVILMREIKHHEQKDKAFALLDALATQYGIEGSIKKRRRHAIRYVLKKYRKGEQLNNIEAAILSSFIMPLKDKTKGEYYFKLLLIRLMIPVAIVNGLTFATLFLMESTYIFTQLTTGAATLAAPVAWFALVMPIALIAGFTFFNLMYKMVAQAVMKNFFRQLKKEMVSAFTPQKLITAKKQGRDDVSLTAGEWIMHGISCVIKAAMLVGIVGLSLVVTLATAEARLDSLVNTFGLGIKFVNSFNAVLVNALNAVTRAFDYASRLTMHFMTVSFITTYMISSALVYAFVIPVEMMFSFTHSLEMMKKFTYLVTHPLVTARYLKDFFADKTWAQTIGYSLFGVFLLVSLAGHTIGEGGVAGQGATTNSGSFISRFFNWLAKYINVPVFSVATTGAVELLEDGDYIADEIQKKVTENRANALTEKAKPAPDYNSINSDAERLIKTGTFSDTSGSGNTNPLNNSSVAFNCRVL